MQAEDTGIQFIAFPSVSDADLNRLFAAAWDGHRERCFAQVLSRSLIYICAFEGDRIIGFVNVAWDGGAHGFILDTTVAPDFQRRGVGTKLIHRAAKAAAGAGLQWLHVDYEPHLARFYRGCGFRKTEAGLMPLPAPPA